MFDDFVQNLLNVKMTKDSLANFVSELNVSNAIMLIIVVFMFVGLIDKIRGNVHGYGEQFDYGFQTMGNLSLSIIGIITSSPILLLLLTPIVKPLYESVGASPAMFPGTLFPIDAGGYAMSMQLAGDDLAVGNYAGLIVASMMGITISFTIPYASTALEIEDRSIFATGILLGIVTLPIGCMIGGMTMMLTSTPIGLKELVINTLPVIILSAVISIGLLLKQNLMIRIFSYFGKCISIISIVGLGLSIFQYLTGIRLPLFYLMVEENDALGMIPLEFAIHLIGNIAIVLAGAFPMILFLNRKLKKLMSLIGKKIGIGKEASTCLLTQLANSIPVWSTIKNMENKGKLLNVAFSVSGSFVLGDVLAFTSGVNPEMVFPVIIANLAGGALSIVLAAGLLKKGRIRMN